MTAVSRDESGIMSPPSIAFIGAVLLTLLAVYNYGIGVYGGSIASALGAIVTTLFGLLSE